MSASSLPVPVAATLAGFSYLAYAPAEADADQALPAVVIMHYLTGRPETLAPLFQALAVPARFICPQGRYPAGEGYSWFVEDFYDQDLPAQAILIRQTAADLAAFLNALPQHLRLADRPVVTGFSQGGDLSYALALGHPECVGMAIPMGGRLEPPFRPAQVTEAARRVPMRVLHGEGDPIVPIERVRDGVAWLSAQGCDVQLTTYPNGKHDAPPEMQKDLRALTTAYLQRAAARA